MDKAKMVAFDPLQCLLKTLRISLPFEIIGDPIPQRRKSTFISGMVMVKVHKIFKGGFHSIFLRIEVPGGTRLHLDRKSADASYVGILVSDHLLELNRLVNIRLLLKGDTEGEKKITEDPICF